MIKSFRVPYKENSLDGVLVKISKNSKSKNILKDKYINIELSTIYQGSVPDVLFNAIDVPSGKSTWWQTTEADTEKWITFDFLSNELVVEGFYLKAYSWDYMPRYELFVYDESKGFISFFNATFNEEPSSEINSFKTTPTKGKIFRFRAYGTKFGNDGGRFALYRFDFFGKLKGMNLFQVSCRASKNCASNIYFYIFLIY